MAVPRERPANVANRETKGRPAGACGTLVSVPPQLIPTDPTLDNYVRVWNQLPIARFFLNSVSVSIGG